MSKPLTDIQAEEQLLSRIPKEPGLLDSLNPEIFSEPKHAGLLRVWLSARLGGEKPTADIAALLNPSLAEFAARMEARPLGGASAKALTEKLESLRLRRKLSSICSSVYDKIQDADSVTEPAEELRRELNGLYQNSSRIKTSTSADVVLELVDDLEWRHMNPGAIRGLASGSPKYDKYIDGKKGGKLYVVGAATSVGKTSDMCNDLHYYGVNGIPAHCTTIEMSRKELMARLVCISSGVNNIKGSGPDGAFSDYDLTKIMGAVKEVGKWDHLHWTESFRITIDEWIRELRMLMGRLPEDQRPRIAFLDHIQAVTLPGKETSAREVGYVAQVCKEAAGEFNIPVVLYSQLKRREPVLNKVKQRTEAPWPSLADLKESGDIENYADTVTLLHRDRDNDPDDLWKIVAKQRDGETYHRFKFNYNGRSYTIRE